jgi:hypothetical protein
MHTALDDAAREIIAQQIPESTYVAYSDASENITTSALPLLAGDKLVFIFNANQVLIARGADKTPGANPDTGATAAGPAYGAAAQNITYTYNSRKIAFYVQVAGDDEAVDGSPISGLTAA